tara:strand:+ start:167 stop:1444 length:1278 start_codon:yes stop_codon:yes gene_type:complete
MTAVRGFQFAEAGIHGQVLCGREFMNSLADSSFQEVKIAIQSTPWLNDYYECGDSYIRTKNKRVHYTFAGLRHSLDSIKSKARILLAWVDEADNVSETAWIKLIPTVREDESEIWVTWNPEIEESPTDVRFRQKPDDDMKIIEMNWRDNPWFPGVLRKEKDRDKNLLTPEMYDHIWEGGYLSVVQGAIYGAELLAAKEQGRITTVDYDPEVEVFTAWDIGHTDDTAIWWYQIVGNEIHVIECFAKSGGSLSEFATQITGIETTIDIIQGEVVVTKHGPVAALEHRQAYKYNTHWLPHDARARVLSAHGKSTQQQLRAALGWNVRITPNLSREDGIQAARTTFARCWFDKDNCLDGLKALRKYQREVQRDEVSLRQNPKHDWTSHYADAFRYLSVAWQEPILPTEEEAQQRDAYEDDDEPNDWKVA